MLFDLTDDAFVNTVINKLEEVGSPILELHLGEDFPPEAVIMTIDHYRKLLDLIPEGEEATKLVMDHQHVVGDG